MKALVFERVVPRFAAARVAATLRGSGRGAAVGPLRLLDQDPPAAPGPDWIHVRPRLAGICGSDLATVDGASSRYFEDLVSFPFVPGHEILGVVEASTGAGASGAASAAGAGARASATGSEGVPGTGHAADASAADASAAGASAADASAAGAGVWASLQPGERVVVEPVLGCVPRALEPPCPACAVGDTGSCQHVAFGHLSPGLQIGYCTDTGGGWSTAGLVAHHSQLHLVPDTMSDEDAVMVEPTACAVHGALSAGITGTDTVAVIGAGTLGLATVAAVRQLLAPSTLLVGARYAHQRSLAVELGADRAVPSAQLERTVRRATHSLRTAGQVTAGADVVIDCVGSADSIAAALAMVRPRGRVVLVGMPGRVTLDLAGLWHRQVSLTGAYAYGTETVDGTRRRTFDLAFDVVAAAHLGRLVSARYPLERFTEALAHAGAAGSRGAVKIVFDLDQRPPRAAPGAPAGRSTPKGRRA